MNMNTMTLVKVAALGGFATAIMGYAARGKIQANIQSSPFYIEAMKQVRTHPAAIHLLGEPIKEGYIDVGKTSKNFIDGNRAQFEVPLKGTKQKGTMFLLARKEDGDKQWTLNQIELEVAERPNQRLLIKAPIS